MGAASETITVEADSVRVQTEHGEVSSVITGQQITQLATNGRSMYSLANLTPGASSGQADFQTPTPVGGDADMSFNGQRMSHNLYMLDGGESSDRGGGGGSDVMPSLDAIGEFRMLTSNYSAEYGLSSAATMTAVIRSGTKQFHASAWEFVRNDALDARNYFNPAPAKVAELRFHTYGFNVGGQVPFWKSHPTFFFYNMEWRSLIQGQMLNQTVPLHQYRMRAVQTAGSISNQPVAQRLQLSLHALAFHRSGDQFVNCRVALTPGSALPEQHDSADLHDRSECDSAVWRQESFPRQPCGNQFIGGNNVPTKVKEEIVRIDHQFSNKFSVFGHWVSEQISQNFGTAHVERRQRADRTATPSATPRTVA